MNQALRTADRGRGIEVFGIYAGGIDTDMLAGVAAEKAAPSEIRQPTVGRVPWPAW